MKKVLMIIAFIALLVIVFICFNKKEVPNTSGRDAITKECERIYPNQKNPKSYKPAIKWNNGGNYPLEEIKVYDAGDYYHFVSYGLTELYEKVNSNKKISGYGMEFTFKLKKDLFDDEENELKTVCNNLQIMARATFTNGELFKPYEYMYTGQTNGIDYNGKSKLTGFISIPDTSLNTINTPNGTVEFVEFIGVTKDEIDALRNKEITVKELYEQIGSDITDYNRPSVLNK